ncbi:DUF7122 family protein [Halocatena salina]|uniref:rRNA small subunit methyltransferase F RNA-binding PUA-like domain-containing protein n=1 Tax=Halocatena salina TaxID=2934340 RepID=A0A8U0A4G7_9EURY|nr:hypothetical protein [Halocatena salina]UPM43982.1 hypothetical protein MW046_05940 [Halocatena salina]
MTDNVSHRFDRLPPTSADCVVSGRPSRQDVLEWWDERFGIDPAVFDGYSFWEKGAGKLWAFAGDVPDPITVEALGLTALRVRQEHWKPTTDAVQRFGHHATRNVIELADPEARTFIAGEDQQLAWDGDWGYLIVTRSTVDDTEPLGVGLYLHGELRSQIPKGRRRDID